MANCDNNPWKKNAWGKSEETAEEPVVCFADVMSEDFIEGMSAQEKEEEAKLLKSLAIQFGDFSIPEDQFPMNTEGMTDEEVAMALQRQFDRENDVARAVASSSGTVSFAPDRYIPKTQQETDSENEEDDETRQKAIELLYTNLDAENACASRLRPEGQGVSRTKHDIGVSGRRNADKTFNDRNTLPTGDMVGDNINNKVYNKLMAFGKSESKRQMRHKDKEEKATMDTSVDSDTRLLLLRWINQEVFDSVDGIIATGKESAVLHAAKNDATSFAIKVYKTTLSEFKNRSEYVKDDFRFKNPRGVLKIWAEREFMNLTRMHKNKLPCPVPVKVKRNVLVMSFLGLDGLAAPRLKNVEWEFFTDEERRAVYDQVEKIMCRMYKDCLLVHADLSEFNLLLTPDNIVHVIDVSQAFPIPVVFSSLPETSTMSSPSSLALALRTCQPLFNSSILSPS